MLDYGAYLALLGSGLTAVEVAKGVSFTAATVFAYFANRNWTFPRQAVGGRSSFRFVLLYSMTLLVNVLANSAALSALSGLNHRVEIAFIASTALSASVNFLGMRHYVFRSKTEWRKS